MKVLAKANLALLILLSFATGIVKIQQMPEEMMLFRGAGIPDEMTIVFGIVQVIGAVLLLFGKIRKWGALIMLTSFVLATIVVFVNNMIVFGAVSILFIAMSYWVYRSPITFLNKNF